MPEAVHVPETVKVERVERPRRASAPQATPIEVPEPIRSGGRRNIARAVVAALGLALAAATLLVWQPWDRAPAAAEQHASLAGGERVPLSAAAKPLPSSVPAPQASQPGASTPAPVPPAIPATTPAHPAAGLIPAPSGGDSIAAEPQILPSAGNPLVGSAAMTANLSGIETRLPISPTELKRHYIVGYAGLAQSLETAGKRAAFTNLLAPSRLGSSDALSSARQALTAASIAVREYRSGEARLERAYQDTLSLVGKQLRLSDDDLSAWTPKPTLREDNETGRLVDVMLAQADGIFGLLLTQQGQYQLSADAIVFTDSETARRYALLRSTLAHQVERWAETPADRIPTTVGYVLRGLGEMHLPVERSATP